MSALFMCDHGDRRPFGTTSDVQSCVYIILLQTRTSEIEKESERGESGLVCG